MRVNDAIARPLPEARPRRNRRIAPRLAVLVTLAIAGLGLFLALRHGAL